MTTLLRYWSAVADWFRIKPANALAAGTFLAMLTGVALLSVPWALIIGGGLGFVLLVARHVLLGGDQDA